VHTLTGYRVAVAAERRAPAVAAALSAAGARVAVTQVTSVVPQPDQDLLAAATHAVVAGRVDELVVSSAYGFRSWLGLAGRLGLAGPLVAALRDARLLARNAAAADSLREVGLREVWSTAASSTVDLLRYLLANPVPGSRVVVEVNDPVLPPLCDALRDAGYDVVEVPTFRYGAAPRPDTVRRLRDKLVRNGYDAVVLTTPESARLMGDFLGTAVPVCFGRATAAPFGADAVTGYVEDLVAAVASALSGPAAGSGARLEVRGLGVVLDGAFHPVPPGPLAVLRVLARSPGRVLSCADIRRAVPGWSDVDDHAVEVAVSRLRNHLDRDLVQVVVKQGYRLAA